MFFSIPLGIACVTLAGLNHAMTKKPTKFVGR